MDILGVVSKNIRKLRKEKGYSQEELALRAGLKRSYMGHIERGDKNVTLTTLRQIALALNVNPSVLLIEHGVFWDGYIRSSDTILKSGSASNKVVK